MMARQGRGVEALVVLAARRGRGKVEAWRPLLCSWRRRGGRGKAAAWRPLSCSWLQRGGRGEGAAWRPLSCSWRWHVRHGKNATCRPSSCSWRGQLCGRPFPLVCSSPENLLLETSAFILPSTALTPKTQRSLPSWPPTLPRKMSCLSHRLGCTRPATRSSQWPPPTSQEEDLQATSQWP